MNVMLWTAIGVMGVITAAVVFEVVLVHVRHEHHPRARPTPRPGPRDQPHAGWFN